MSSSSDSDEYYDAEDITPSKLPSCKKPKTVSLTPSKSESDFQSTLRDEKRQDVGASPRVPSSLGLQFASELASFEKYQSKRHKLRELRRKMQMEDEEVGGAIGTSPTSSQTSSFDGVFPGPDTKSSHPFRIIEHDALSLHSLTSLSRTGRIQSASQEQASQTVNTGTQFSPTDAAANSTFTGSTTTLRHFEGNEAPTNPPINEPGTKHDAPKLQEPDVIASTKAGGTSSVTSVNSPPVDSCHQQSPAPIAPPRKRKQAKTAAQPPPNTLPIKQHEQPKVSKSNADELSGRRATLPSPASTIESITREFEHSLDISAATKGQCIVKPQDNSENKSKCFRSGRNSSTYPLGSGVPGGSGPIPGGKRERRKSAGDEQTISNQLNMFVRTQTDSGKPLSDLEILEQVTVLNLDTGERVPLSIAEDKLPQCINPLSLHIMRLTSEYVSNTSLEKGRRESDEDSLDSKLSRVTGIDGESEAGMVKRRTAQVKKFFGTAVKKTMSKAKTIGRHNKEDPKEEVIDEPSTSTGEQYIKIKASSSHKGPYEFEFVQHVQDLSGHHMGPVWCMKFSVCGRLLATAGQDRVLRIWVVRSAYDYFQDIRTKYQVEKVSPTPSQESIVSQISSDDTIFHLDELSAKAPFMPKPFCTYTGHTSDLLDVSWSKNYFILSSSMDKTVRLWHISRKECLCCFQHIDFVTAIVFHPRDDRYFLSGSLDGKLRLWNIPDKKVAVWKEVDGPAKLITAANFCENGKFAVVGSYDGRCIFYTTDQLKYHTTIHVRSTRGKNATGRKISGIEPMPGEEKILITSNDSRIRLYDLRELNLSCKYKGYANLSSQIKASFSHDGKFIVSGSENQCIYIWKSNHDYSTFSSVRRDRNDYWEGIKIHNAVVTCAVFSPNPDIVMRKIDELEGNTTGVQTTSGYVLVSADFNGSVKVLLNKTKPKHSSLPASALA